MILTKKNVSNEKVYVFLIDENLEPCIERAKSIIDNLKKTNDTNTREISNSLLLNPVLKDLHSWFQECINFAIKDLGFEKQELEITHSWGNKFDKLKFSQRHTDKNSLITGIFALSDASNKNIFLRYDRSVWYKMILNHGNAWSWYTGLGYGQLILFPSSVAHGTTPGGESEELYTISFNTFLKDFSKQNLNYKRMEASI